ncbi:hypothetical protein LX36DRAFT_659626 [Colletotrichum falcatum]|nr:hypothetical protein LX36DRAFT_659626 [Colletotrichum falcatum]
MELVLSFDETELHEQPRMKVCLSRDVVGHFALVHLGDVWALALALSVTCLIHAEFINYQRARFYM